MLTKEQQKIVIESMRSYDPIRIAYNAWDSKKDFIELLYEFNEEVDLMDTTHIILDLEDAFGCEVNLVHYDCINRFSKERVLGEAIEFFNERNTTREVAGTIG
ncbi:MAG: hypothetical protein OXC92_03700 [Flavobacteriaceae bacterium]|nr:hypothetical protein [Flavobacteriaceae bacterium]MCY4216075.1 hypothetical protein [Flavobacteriaceae bacterium]MCY4254317.1 hypothetical protein [Flavobacteriaceae bacterium]MCY4268443.1 hypothetical protein [Flavobacteriaceae bacterium]